MRLNCRWVSLDEVHSMGRGENGLWTGCVTPVRELAKGWPKHGLFFP